MADTFAAQLERYVAKAAEYCPDCGAADNCGDCDHTPPAEGTRIKAAGWAPSRALDDNEIVPPGTLGTVNGHGPGQTWVAWDNGARLALCRPTNPSLGVHAQRPDRWEYA